MAPEAFPPVGHRLGKWAASAPRTHCAAADQEIVLALSHGPILPNAAKNSLGVAATGVRQAPRREALPCTPRIEDREQRSESTAPPWETWSC